jgi:hypothetical protein
MAEKIFLIVFVSFSLIACAQNQNRKEAEKNVPVKVAEKAFLENLAGFCGKSFRGKETYTAPGRQSWAEKDFVMHVTVCEADVAQSPGHTHTLELILKYPMPSLPS